MMEESPPAASNAGGSSPMQNTIPAEVSQPQDLRSELGAMFKIAAPLVLAEIGWMLMGVVDTLMCGRVSTTALAAVSLGSISFYTFGVFGQGVLLGLDTLVSQSWGAKNPVDCRKSLVNGLWIALLAFLPLMGFVWALIPFLSNFGVDPNVLREAIPYLKAVSWSTLPLLLYSALRRYLQGSDRPTPVMFALLSANLVNVFINWLLIYGNWGFPRMGAEGSGWATTISRVYMAAVLAIPVWRERAAWQWSPDWQRVTTLLKLGLPAAAQISLEVGVFAAVTALIGRLGAVPLAGHQIALNGASLTYMVPLGVSSAAAVRVGHAIGRHDAKGARHAGLMSLAIGMAFMSLAALAFLAFPRWIASGFTVDPKVIEYAVGLLAIAAVFQLFDGIQVVSTGALRGAGDTRTPMLVNLGAYWLVGLPLGYWLAFSMGWGAYGLWTGLCVALILMAVFLSLAWRSVIRQMTADEAR
jgi:MATE family multidrug resistance protein